ncbi:hypothetical protein Mal15_12310 [Stieleria maiorica]|uniref:Uncharacterized protein n=2 Tax=Stieleria maiorica TaxID=2795974 RepID=A0A5B9M940_9BACT|nr:hypothetical protein Mal15_12310 [Stieleria maiorica]
MVIVGIAISHLRTSAELRVTKSENKRLRDELGVLTVEDETAVSLLAVPTAEQDCWRWRIHMPADLKLRIGITDAGVIPLPRTQVNAGENLAYFDDPLPVGENLVEAKLYLRGDGVWAVSVRTSDATMTCALQNGDHEWLDGTAFFRTRFGSTTSRIVDSTKVIPLLRHVVVKHDSIRSPTSKPNPGIMIWLEPVK